MPIEKDPSLSSLVRGRFDPDDESAINKAKAKPEEIKAALSVAQNDDYLSGDKYALRVIRDGGITHVDERVVVLDLTKFIESRRNVHLMQRSNPTTPDDIIREQSEIQADNLKDSSN